MRNEDLRNKLNDVPQDFDREQLWTSIDLPKKKRKRRGFFWLFFIGIATIGAISISIFNYQNNTPQLFTSDEEYDSFKSEPTSKSLVDSNVTSESESMATLNSSPIDKNSFPIDKKTKAQKEVRVDKVDELNDFQDNTGRLDLSKDDANYKDARMNSERSIYSIGINTNEKISDNKKDVESKNIDVISQNNSGNSNESIVNTDRESEKNVLLLPLPYSIELLPKDNRFDLRIDQMIVEKNYTGINYGASVFALFGKSNHDFGNSLNRTANETALENFAFGLLGQVRINNFELFPGFSFTKHNTVFNKEIQTNSLLDGVNGPTRKTKTTLYSLYNSYQYLDVNLGVGYILSLGKRWSIRPSFHGSYTISFDPNGDIVNQNDELVQLANLDEYNNYTKWQGRVHLEVSRTFGQYWKVGITGYLSTSKTLANFDDYSHSVSSQGIGLTISRYLK